jgi:hypothetical protein
MANIALDIKANTTKALGEFKKLSRELDNKFLVQGLKLDVVKNAFRQITKEFDSAVGQQGLKTAETTGQLQRSLQLQLGTLRKFNGQVSKEVSENLQGLLLDLQAQGKITGEVVKDSLNIAAFLDFDGTTEQRKRGFANATRDIALFIQQSKDLFGGDEGAAIKRGLSGELSVEDLLNLDLSSGGAASNRFKTTLLKYADALKSIDPTTRTDAYLKVIRELQSDQEYQTALKEVAPIKAVFREIQGLFSPQGLFGALRTIGPQIRNLDGTLVDRNLLQVTGKLLGTIFDREEGLFAVLFKSIGEVFGEGDPLNVILSGVEVFTSFIAKIRDFFGSDQFKGILEFFVPVIDSIKSIFTGGFEFNSSSINDLITSIFDGIKSLINTVSEYIQGLDAAAIGSVLGNIVSQIAGLIPPLITLVFEIAKKAFLAIGQSGPGGIALFSGLAGLAVANRGFDLATGQRGGVLGGINRNLRDRTQTRARRIRGGISNITQGRRRGTGLIGAARRGGNSVLNRLLGITERSIDVDYKSGNPDLARPGVFTGWQGEVIRKFNQIIIIMRDAVPVYFKSGGASYRGGSRGPGGRVTGSNVDVRGRTQFGEDYGPPTRRDFIASRAEERNQRAADLRRQRQRRDFRRGFGSRIGSVGGRFRGATSRLGRMGGRLTSGIGDLASGLGGFITGPDYLGGMADTYMNAGTQYMAPIGPLPLNSRDPYAENFATGGYDPRMISDLTPDARNRAIQSRFDRRYGGARGAMRGLRFRGRGMMGGLRRGLGRLGGPLAGAALTAFSLASLFGGDANAGEMEGMTAEDQRQMRRDRNRQVLGGLAGIAGGAAGGALLGSTLGPVGTVLGGILGGFLGEEAVKSLSDPIIDGIGDFAGKVGGFFKGIWDGAGNIFSSALEGIGGFFGEKGPIQTTWRFLMDIPKNVKRTLENGWSTITSIIRDLPSTVLTAALGPLGLLAQPIIDAITGDEDGKFLGGVGTGLTLVGENGPELVNLGTGSVVTPQTSFAGLGVGRGQQAPTTNNIVINVNAPGADEFADTLSVQVIDKLEEMYKEQKALQGGIS